MRKKKKSLSKQIKESAKTPVQEKEKVSTSRLVPTGSTLLNLALSDNPYGGFMLGKLVNLIGDRSTGKSFLYYTMLAESCRKKRFKEYELYHDDVESAIEYDVERLFGSRLQERIIAPYETEEGEARGSKTIQEFHKKIWNLIKEGNPFLYGLDSFDALTSDEEIARIKEIIGDGKSKGSYKTEKTRGLSEMLRLIIQELDELQSLLVIISQVRENMDRMPFTPKFNRTGGKALGHNCTHELWLARIKKIKKNDRVIGSRCLIKITKNRITGKEREVEFDIYNEYGIDDIGSCTDFLIKEGYWKKIKGKYIAKGLGITATKEKIISTIEDKGLEKELKKVTARAWYIAEAKLKLDRKKKYQ